MVQKNVFKVLHKKFREFVFKMAAIFRENAVFTEDFRETSVFPSGVRENINFADSLGKTPFSLKTQNPYNICEIRKRTNIHTRTNTHALTFSGPPLSPWRDYEYKLQRDVERA